VSLLILGIVVLVLGNTLAMTVRERRKEYATLRAIGFSRKQVSVLILGEAALLGLVGGVVGLALAFPLVGQAASRYLEQSLQLQPLDISLESALLTLSLGWILGVLASVFPAFRLTRENVVESLRRVG
jgi:putative ABC transport system permease protein